MHGGAEELGGIAGDRRSSVPCSEEEVRNPVEKVFALFDDMIPTRFACNDQKWGRTFRNLSFVVPANQVRSKRNGR